MSSLSSETHTKKTVSANCQREAVCDVVLSQPFGSRLSDSADYSLQAADLIRAMARLISAFTEGFPSREAGGQLSQRRLH